MAILVNNRVQETCSAPGTGTVTLLGAVSQYRSFSAGIGANNQTYYVIADQTGANWEVGIGTIGSGGTTLARTIVLDSSNGGSLTNFSSGTQAVWADYPANSAVLQTDVGTAPNQVPLNQFLGTMAYQDQAAILSLGTLGFGLNQGAGSSVTQLTSRTTGVTINSSTGSITMFSAAGSTTAATFTVTNSKVAINDTIILNTQASTNLYVLLVTAVAAGSFKITFYTTGGTSTDAPIINFSVIKGSAA